MSLHKQLFDSLETWGNVWFVIRILCWALSTVWCIFVIHEISVFGPIY